MGRASLLVRQVRRVRQCHRVHDETPHDILEGIPVQGYRHQGYFCGELFVINGNF